jgi:adenine-specific DNA-methyltransferase
MAHKPKKPKTVATLKHKEAKRTNIPTAEYQSVMQDEDKAPVKVTYPRGDKGLTKEKEQRNRDLDPQLVWRGKDTQDWSDLVVNAPPLYIQEKVKPKVLIDDLMRQSKAGEQQQSGGMADLFGDFNGLPEGADKTDFYHYQGNWQNRMILGDSLQVMASLAEREGLRGKVQCIYFDPPYGIKFNSNFQWSTTSRDVKDGNADHITREPEQVKAFRDTWRDGIHSYLTYLRDRLTVARDLLTESGSIFVQIGDENVHRVRAVMDEVFGDENFISLIQFRTKIPLNPIYIGNICDFVIWYSNDPKQVKFRRIFQERAVGADSQFRMLRLADGSERPWTKDELNDPTRVPTDADPFRLTDLIASGHTDSCHFHFSLDGHDCYPPGQNSWKTTPYGMRRIVQAERLRKPRKVPSYQFRFSDYPAMEFTNQWADTQGASGKTYVVQTANRIIERCVLMSTDPGDLVLDPTCGSGTTAYVAEQWGRRWITLDTSRVALALARARIMGVRYPYYLLADSPEGQHKEAEITRSVPSSQPTYGNIAHGLVYQRVPHITLGSIANNTEIDVIWDKFEAELASLREKLTAALPKDWLAKYRKQQKYTAEVPAAIQEWEVPRDINSVIPAKAGIQKDKDCAPASAGATEKTNGATNELESLLAEFWKLRIARQKDIDASIAAKADSEYLYDKPYEDKKKVRVAGPFTVESLSPHRVLGVDENDELIDGVKDSVGGDERDFAQMILENLRTAGVQQAHKDDRITFTSLAPWPGELVCAEGRYLEGSKEKRAGIFIGPEFGTVSRPDLVEAAREAGDAGFDVLIACAFGYDAHSSEFEKLGRIPVLKARMNADLHMADDLKNTGKGNLFVIFGEPDIDVLDAGDGQIKAKVNGVDVFKPQTGEVVSDGPDGIACWFVDTDYNEESFFVRQAYFLGANDPYKSLKTTLKAEINAEAWETLHSDTSRPFPKPATGRIAVKVINHFGDEVMKVFRV